MPRRFSPLCLVLVAAAAAGLAVRAASKPAPARAAQSPAREMENPGFLDEFFSFDGDPQGQEGETVYTEAERVALVAYWNAPGRYRSGLPPEAAQNGPWQVRLTPDGSRWFLAYQRAIGAGPLPPSVDAMGVSGAAAAWEKWVQAKLAYDRGQAQATADAANGVLRLMSPEMAMGKGDPPASSPPDPPGPIPPGLLETVGNPPPFANAVVPLRHTVTFDDGDIYAYNDNVALRPRYAYYRFPQGTVAYGTALRDMPEAELNPLFAAAGMTPSEQRIARAVSRLEGGFETINTYDTGFVSVGFIQFVTLESGRESLSEVLMQEKVNQPVEYERDFRRFGIDLDVAGQLVAVDPATGAELIGPPAVLKVIEDKRLTAVFQRAGRSSLPFRVAQVRVAKAHYWPAADPVTIQVGGQEVTGTVADVIRSEAGIATLFDRKVNRGTIAPFPDVLTRVMAERKLSRLADAAAYEREIVAALKYRVDFLADRSLEQPR